ncbi:MAG: OmpH family outer membrane protein [Spirochaetota bacterium]
MKKIILILTAAAITLCAEERFTKVGYIRLDQIYATLAKDREAREALNLLVADAKKKIEDLAAQIKQLKQRLDTDTTLSENRKKELRNDIDWKNDELTKLVKEQEQSINAKGDDYLKESNRKISEAVRALARKEGYSMIFVREESGIMFAEPEYDISMKVIDYLKQLAKEAGKK